MAKMNVECLHVYRLSHALTLDLYKLTAKFPIEEKFGLVSQIRRASSSVCANLIEGSHRESKNEYRRFATISRGSVGELKYHLLLGRDLRYISEDRYEYYLKIIDRVSRMLHGLIKSLENFHLSDNR